MPRKWTKRVYKRKISTNFVKFHPNPAIIFQKSFELNVNSNPNRPNQIFKISNLSSFKQTLIYNFNSIKNLTSVHSHFHLKREKQRKRSTSKFMLLLALETPQIVRNINNYDIQKHRVFFNPLSLKCTRNVCRCPSM